MSNDIHDSPEVLIVEAAEKSGLLREVAEFLRFASQHRPPADCAVCELLDRLAAAFDAHICMPSIVAEGFYGCEGLNISPRPGEAEKAQPEAPISSASQRKE